MQSQATCAVGWTWRPTKLSCKSLFVGLKWIQWIGLPSSTFGENARSKNTYARLTIVCVTNQDCFLTTQNILLYNPKMRRHFRIKCKCMSIDIHLKPKTFWIRTLDYTIKLNTLDLKLNVKWASSTIHTGRCSRAQLCPERTGGRVWEIITGWSWRVQEIYQSLKRNL